MSLPAAAPDQPTSSLTERQREVLKFIKNYIFSEGYPPSRMDICKEFGLKSINSGETYLRTLERKGYIQLTPGVSRGIRIVYDASSS